MRDGGYQVGRRHRRHLSIFICLVLIFVLSTTVAHAITIVIDGDRDTLWDGDGAGQMPGVATDENEQDPVDPDKDIPDNVDIKEFRWTNDAENMYFLIEVYGPPPSLSDKQFIDICLDTDNDPDTTVHPDNVQQLNRCHEIDGMDTVVRAEIVLSSLTAAIYDVASEETGQFKGVGQAARGNVIEMSVPLALIGFEDCSGSIPMTVYYDNAISAPDDRLPDQGTVAITCGAPTAVSMHSASTVVNSPVSSSALLAGLVLTIVSGGVILRRERRA